MAAAALTNEDRVGIHVIIFFFFLNTHAYKNEILGDDFITLL